MLLGRALDDLVEVGFLAPAARPGAEELCWSTVHGFALLALAGHVDGTEVTNHLARLLVAIDRSFAASTGTVPDGAALTPA